MGNAKGNWHFIPSQHGVAGLSLACPAGDPLGVWCLRAGEAVALLLQLLWGTVDMSGIYQDLGALPELKLVPCLCHQATQHGLEGLSHIF